MLYAILSAMLLISERALSNCFKMNLAKFSEIFDKKKTFRPKKKFQPGTMKYSLHKQAQVKI